MQKDTRKKLENLYALDGALQKKRNEEARNTVTNIMAESEKDFQLGTGIFALQWERKKTELLDSKRKT